MTKKQQKYLLAASLVAGTGAVLYLLLRKPPVPQPGPPEEGLPAGTAPQTAPQNLRVVSCTIT